MTGHRSASGPGALTVECDGERVSRWTRGQALLPLHPNLLTTASSLTRRMGSRTPEGLHVAATTRFLTITRCCARPQAVAPLVAALPAAGAMIERRGAARGGVYVLVLLGFPERPCSTVGSPRGCRSSGPSSTSPPA